MNPDHASLSEVLFFGMRLKAGREEVYSIENEEGQMEICHLTNCALVSDSTSKKPIYVRMKNPDVDSEFVIGALVPGQVYSFQTDLLITPDTKFSHSGGPNDEVHLTGYRTVNSESMLMGEDIEDTDDEMEEDEEDEEDADFVVDDDNAELEAEGEGHSDDDEENEESDDEEGSGEDEEEAGGTLEQKAYRGKVDIKEEKEFARVVKERGKGNDIAAHPDMVDSDIKALEGGSNQFMWGGESSSEEEVDEGPDAEGDLGPPDGEEVDNDEEVQRHMAELMAEDSNMHDKDEEEDEESDDADSDDDESDGDDENGGVGSILRTKRRNDASNGGAKAEPKRSKKAGKGIVEEEDEDADPSTRAKAVTLARQQKEKIEREKQKQQLNGAKKPSKAESPTVPQEKSSKKRKASAEAEGDENNGPAKKAANGLKHPTNASDATQQYAEAIHKALSAHGKPMTMALLSQKVKKPETAEKIGKLVGRYDCFTRGQEGKGRDIVSLTD